MGKYLTHEIGNHADLVPALSSDLLSDFVSHSGPKLHLLLRTEMFFCHRVNPIESERATTR